VLRFFLAAASAIALSACGGPTPQPLPPAADYCPTATVTTLSALTLGAGNPADLSGGMSPFAPLHDGDSMQIVHGGQGATMLGFVFDVAGTPDPTCLGQTTAITDGAGVTIAQSSLPLTTYGQADGTRVTRPLWLPAAYPTDFVVTVDAGGQSLTLHLLLAQ
jgi:hypothetical protein